MPPVQLMDRCDAYLRKRDGVDKALKLVCYASKFYAWAKTKDGAASEAAERAARLGAACSDARGAMRTGKFLGNVVGLRDALKALGDGKRSDDKPTQREATARLCAVLCELGEGCHYFVEQLRWLAKRNVIDKRRVDPLTLLSAWLELLGYVGEAPMLYLRWADATDKERECRAKATARDADAASIVRFSKDAAAARAKAQRYMLAYLAVLADAAVAVGDTGKSRTLAHPAVEAVLSLVSASINASLKF